MFNLIDDDGSVLMTASEIKSILLKVLAFGLAWTIFLCAIGAAMRAREEKKMAEYKAGSIFELVEEGPEWDVYYDKETKVMYTMSKGSDDKSLKVMLNANGDPMLYEESPEEDPEELKTAG